MSKWLVIGASSFTGSHFIKYLRNRGEIVQPASWREPGETVLLNHAPNADYIVNFAAANVVAPSWRYPEMYMQVNATSLVKLLERLRGYQFTRYVHISTPEVYGSTRGLVREDAPFNPSTPYAVSRAAAEMMLRCYHKQHGFPVVFTRSCNVYGPGQQLYRLIPKLIASIKIGAKFPLEGNGHSVRSFLHVRDVCEAIYRVAGAGKAGEAYHITSPLSWSIAGLVKIICTMMGRDPEQVIEEAPERPGKDAAYLLDDTKVRRMGWNDSIDMEAGIAEVIKWMDDNWDEVSKWPMEYRV